MWSQLPDSLTPSPDSRARRSRPTQLPGVPSLTPSSRATCAIGFPGLPDNPHRALAELRIELRRTNAEPAASKSPSAGVHALLGLGEQVGQHGGLDVALEFPRDAAVTRAVPAAPAPMGEQHDTAGTLRDGQRRRVSRRPRRRRW
jgi:hypothetical protein